MPFSIDVTNPTDNSLVAAFPANERTHRQELKNIITAEHLEADGTHSFPSWTTAGRPGTPTAGMLGWNTDDNAIDFYDISGPAWRQLRTTLNVVGEIMMVAFDPTTPPPLWLPCNGAEVAQSSYPELYAAMGSPTANDEGFNESPYEGVCSDPATLFRVPDMRGREPVGYHDAGDIQVDPDGDYAVVGEDQGARTHVLLRGELPPHYHYYRDWYGTSSFQVFSDPPNYVFAALTYADRVTGYSGGGTTEVDGRTTAGSAFDLRSEQMTVGFVIFANA